MGSNNMNEIDKVSSERVDDLLAFSLALMSGEDGKKLVEKYRDSLDHITPYDMLEMEDRQIKMGIDTVTIKRDLDRVINVIFESLKNFEWQKPSEGHFLHDLILENQAYEFQLNQIKRLIRDDRKAGSKDFAALKSALLKYYLKFREFDVHYLKEQNVLFPYLEKNWKNARPLQVMWSLQDDIRKSLKRMIELLQSEEVSREVLYREIGVYYFLVFGMIQKESLVVYPIAFQTLSEKDWHEMYLQSFEYGFAFIEAPQIPPEIAKSKKSVSDGSVLQEGEAFKLISETGELDPDQILLMINGLPLDITFVDENDRVRFFSRPEERFFPRSPAIIGRKVQNCHPPESVHIVEEILKAFKNGDRDEAKFWIRIKGRLVVIRYFALRNSQGEYRGVLEVSQDVTDIQSLKGEQRLLNWKL